MILNDAMKVKIAYRISNTKVMKAQVYSLFLMRMFVKYLSNPYPRHMAAQ
jgi:hypothetical protein